MVAFKIFIVAYFLINIGILGICAWIKDDGHKKLLAGIIRHIDSYILKRKRDI